MVSASQLPFGTLGKEIRERIENDFDAKIIVTSHNSQPGLGKTTLAILMARAWDPHGWSAEDKAFMNAHEFHNAYMEEPEGTVLLFDEIENEADARRAVSSKNVELSQMLATQRFRNIVSIYTLPAVSMLDSRIMELADYWINVMDRGRAHPHKIYVNDYSGEVYRKWIGQADPGTEGEIIRWKDVSEGRVDHLESLVGDGDYDGQLETLQRELDRVRASLEDKEYLDALKRQHAHLEREYVPQSEVQKKIDKAEEQAKLEKRNEAMKELYDDLEGLSQSDLANMEWVDLSQQSVQRIVSD